MFNVFELTEDFITLWEEGTFLTGVLETLYLTFISTLLAYLVGIPVGVILNITSKNGIRPNKWINIPLGIIVNIFRSVPFIILLVALFPMAKAIVGKTYGSEVMILALTVAAIPYISRVVESSLNEVDKGVVEAASSIGANSWQIITKVLLPEAKPSLINGGVIAIVTILGYSAMADMVSGGGLGEIAISLGFDQFNDDIVWFCVLLTIIIVQVIQELGMYDSEIEYSNSILGQSTEIIPANQNVLLTLNNKYQQLAEETYVIQTSFLDYLKLEFQDKPYLIQETSAGPVKYDPAVAANEQPSVLSIVDSPSSLESENMSMYMGYLARINDKTIIIPPEGIYTLDNAELQVTSLEFPVETKVIIDYNIKLDYVVDVSQLVKNRNYYQKVGQVRGLFTEKDSFYNELWQKYYEQYTSYTQTIVSIDQVRIEADPGTIVYIKEALDDNFDRHVIGETCSLSIGDTYSSIDDMYFTGIHFEKKTDNSNPVYPRYIETGLIANNTDEIEAPKQGEVYTVGLERKIWYNGEWYTLDGNNDIECPIQVMIDYTCEIMKGMY